MVRIMKEMLSKVLGRASLTLFELQTVLCDCEAIINSRPLTYVGNDENEDRPLTPSMFIQPINEHSVPDIDVVDNKSLNVRARYCQRIREDLRRHFRNEYVAYLIHKGKQHRATEVQVGDIVLVEQENQKRILWPLARVTEIYTGADGHSRVTKVRTASGEKVRPLQRLFPLDIHYHIPESLPVPLVTTLTPDPNVPETSTPSRLPKKSMTLSGRASRPPDGFTFK
ncbi:uncharacterized protein LOC113236652 [Hyposmocoma kahamanoa]|uniref:uncharacterized protein LOC113236652 n=1 Tax=Hyposmocoma kahamanoa TaxID=1477025 RepID=UPI000E6D9186|nr:uncharacterized protein LOC113236652 [Hyposmocoma kahamanoa]